MKTLDKKELRDQRYYTGFAHQNYCVTTGDEQILIAMWDIKTNSFWYWKTVGSIKRKTEIPFFSDLNSLDEINDGFVAIKEVIPKEEFLIE